MAIAFVGRTAIVSSVAGQTNTGAVGGTFTAGNLLVAIVGWSTSVAAPTTIDVPSGWTAPLAIKNNGAPNGGARAYYMANNPGGAQTWTWTLTPGSATAQSWGVEILEFSGADTTSPLDLTAVSGATGASSSVSLDTTAASGTTQSGSVLVQLSAIDRSAAGTETSSASSVPTAGWTVLAVTTSTNGVPNCSVSGQYQILSGTQASPRGIITSSISESSESFLLTFLVPGSTLAHTGEADGVGGSSSTLTEGATLTGEADGLGATTGTLTETALLTGVAAGVGGATSVLTETALLTGTAAGLGGSLDQTAGSHTGTVNAHTGTAAALGGTTGTLTERAALTGLAAGIATATSTLAAQAVLTGLMAGIGSATDSGSGHTSSGGGLDVSDYIRWRQAVITVTEGRY